jgi:hypothetical protein
LCPVRPARLGKTAGMNQREDLYAGGFQAHDQLDPADSLAGDIGDDPLDAGYSPPERDPAATRWGTTLDEQRRGESLAQHLAEEEPEVCEQDLDEVDEDARAGRLVASEDETDVARDFQLIGHDVGRAGWASSAEEAAMHIVQGEPTRS